MYFTSGNDRAFEQPQPRPEQPDEAAPGLENSVLENPTSDNPTPGNPTLENPMQLNKDISSKEKTTTDVSITDSIPILSRPFPSEDEAAQPPERKGTGAKSQSAIEIYREIIMDNIEYEHLCQHAKGIDRETLDEIVDLLVETVCSVRKTIRIAGDDYPAELVKSKFMKLDSQIGQADNPSAASGGPQVSGNPKQGQDQAAPRPAEPKAAQKARGGPVQYRDHRRQHWTF